LHSIGLWGEPSIDKMGYVFSCLQINSNQYEAQEMHTGKTYGGAKRGFWSSPTGEGWYDAETAYLDRQWVFAGDNDFLTGFKLHSWETEEGMYYRYDYNIARER
jgi:hypothetical protein